MMMNAAKTIAAQQEEHGMVQIAGHATQRRQRAIGYALIRTQEAAPVAHAEALAITEMSIYLTVRFTIM
jgi:hypothetical protein